MTVVVDLDYIGSLGSYLVAWVGADSHGCRRVGQTCMNSHSAPVEG